MKSPSSVFQVSWHKLLQVLSRWGRVWRQCSDAAAYPVGRCWGRRWLHAAARTWLSVYKQCPSILGSCPDAARSSRNIPAPHGSKGKKSSVRSLRKHHSWLFFWLGLLPLCSILGCWLPSPMPPFSPALEYIGMGWPRVPDMVKGTVTKVSNDSSPFPFQKLMRNPSPKALRTNRS